MNSSSSPDQARRFRVSGRVQGVFFRASTAAQARAWSLRGCACNEADGSVLVLAAGPAAALERLEQWLRTGPPMARVDELQVEVIDPAATEWPPGFEAR